MSGGGLHLVRAGEEAAADWDAYVGRAPAATFFHLFGWRRVIEKCYGYRGCYLAAMRGGEIAGVLPLIDVRSPLLGRNLISTAFTVGGGVLADDPATALFLAQAALEEGRRCGAGYVELRSARAAIEGWAVKDSVYATFERPLAVGEDAEFAAIPRRRRAELRKALAALSGGDLAVDRRGDVDVFYDLYACALREHGTPVFPRKFARALADEFPDRADILVIRTPDAPVLALLSFTFRDRVMPYYFGATRQARGSRAFDLAIWLKMRDGHAQGLKTFDFGRSKYGTGSFDYKCHWGFEPKPLEYQYALLGARASPNVNPQNPKFALASAAWRRLPLAVANAAGPMLARHLA
ncbi:MAG: FemAB family PEP-CTERM system-associated protein [Alphaproteobacteria bacterium]|nr:FemAB family PEP-CTERM system-associated protein [Alphaproteobacteria bacterium]